MPNLKFQQLALATPISTDIFPFVQDPFGTPADKRTTFAGALAALGGLASINADITMAQLLSVGTSGIDFAILDAGGGSHIFNLPTASAVNRGALSSTDWSTFNNKLSIAITSLNADTTAAQLLVLGSAGTDFGITNVGATHTINLPIASATNTGKLSSTDWSTFNSKVDGTGTAGSVAFWSSSTLLSSDTNLFWDNANKRLGIGNITPATALDIVGSVTSTGQFLSGDGTASNPTYSFSSAANLGLYKSGSTSVRLIANGISGLDFGLTSTPTINTIQTTGLPSIRFQNQTLTPSGNDSAIFIIPTWASANFNFTTLSLTGTQNGANTQTLAGLSIAMTKATAATTLATMAGAIFSSPTVTGTVTSSTAITIQDQSSGSITTSRGIVFSNTGVANSIVWGNSALQYANTTNNIRFTDSTNVGGIDFNLTTTSATFNTVTQNNASIVLQNQTFTAGASHNAVFINPTWVSENFLHTGLSIQVTQNGANTNSLIGLSISAIKATAATTLTTMSGINIATPTITGTVTTSQAILINTQVNGNATTSRGIVFSATGSSNSIHWGASALQYANTTNNVRFTDNSVTGGLDINLTTTSVTLNTVTQNAATIILQTQTFTPGTVHNAVQINPTWVSENFSHSALNISPTQNGANTSTLSGLNISMLKATAATTLTNMWGITIGTGNVTGTVTNSAALRIGDQTQANSTNVYGILMASTGVANSISWGTSALQYASAAQTINFADSTNTRSMTFVMSAAGNQTISTTGGSLAIGTSIIMQAGQTVARTAVGAGNYTVLVTDFIIGKTAITLAGDTVTLPSAATAGVGKRFSIKDESGTAAINNITVNTASGNIDGAATKVLNTNYSNLTVYSDGTNYFID